MIETELDHAGTVCISEHGVYPAHRLATNLVQNDLEKLCGERGCEPVSQELGHLQRQPRGWKQ